MRTSPLANQRQGQWGAWRQPTPWVALVILGIASVSAPPRLWFWVALLAVVLVVGWVKVLRRPQP